MHYIIPLSQNATAVGRHLLCNLPLPASPAPLAPAVEPPPDLGSTVPAADGSLGHLRHFENPQRFLKKILAIFAGFCYHIIRCFMMKRILTSEEV